MKQIQSTAYSQTLERRIVETEEAARNIHAGNILFFAPCVFNRQVKKDIVEFEYSDTANINGYDCDKLNAMVRYLKAGMSKIACITGTFEADTMNKTYTVLVPEGFDGRNSFVSCGTLVGIDNKYSVVLGQAVKLRVTANESNIIFDVRNMAGAKFGYVILLRRSI